MMDIEFGDYRITADDRQYILQSGGYVQKKDTRQKKGGIYYRKYRYFAQIEHLLNALMSDHVRESDATTLKEVVEAVREAREWAQKAVEGV